MSRLYVFNFISYISVGGFLQLFPFFMSLNITADLHRLYLIEVKMKNYYFTHGNSYYKLYYWERQFKTDRYNNNFHDEKIENISYNQTST